MITLSLCMIVRDEEAVLARCLDSVKDAVDEIIIVDTGSKDATCEIAARYTDRIYDFAWIDDFSAARNAAFSHATMQYCMWLDADDILPPDDRDALLAMKEAFSETTDVVMMKYHIAFDAEDRPTFTYYRERILRNCPLARWNGAIHEAIAPFGTILYSDIAVEHRKAGPGDPDRNLRIFEGMLRDGKALVPREQFYYGRELYYHARYADAASVLESYLADGQGWLENVIEACRTLACCKYRVGEEGEAIRALFQSFAYDVPRAETCCDIGKHFLNRGQHRQAAYWYEAALDCERTDGSGGFVLLDCYGYLPCIQLCVCYDRLGERGKAIEYNERAGTYKPNDASFLANRKYFAKAKEEQG